MPVHHRTFARCAHFLLSSSLSSAGSSSTTLQMAPPSCAVIFLSVPSDGTFDDKKSSPDAWFSHFCRAIAAHATAAASLDAAEIIIPDLDPLVAHYPSFLEASAHHPQGKEGFFKERHFRWLHLWRHVIPRALLTLATHQRLVLLDIETAQSPGSELCHDRKRAALPVGERRVVHVSLCMHVGSYRPGIDVSFPAVLPAALGSAAQRDTPPEQRPLLLSFQGRRTHPIRQACLALHNGSDIVCVDSTARVAAASSRTQMHTAR